MISSTADGAPVVDFHFRHGNFPFQQSDARDEKIANDIKRLTHMFVDKQIDDMRWEINNFAASGMAIFLSGKSARLKSLFQFLLVSIIDQFHGQFHFAVFQAVSVFLSVFVVLAGLRSSASLLEWAVGRLGLETRWMRKTFSGVCHLFPGGFQENLNLLS